MKDRRKLKVIWSNEETEVLKANYAKFRANGSLALLPNKTLSQVRGEAARLGLTIKPIPHGREKFGSKFRVTPGCWLWMAGLGNKGYGQYWNGKKNTPAHRASYELYVGSIPPDLHVCHKCDNPPCVNPDHLWLGTTQENTADRERKGRGSKVLGSAQSTAKLTDEQALEIRRASGMHKEIAARYGISTSNVSYIKSLKTWAHLKDEETES